MTTVKRTWWRNPYEHELFDEADIAQIDSSTHPTIRAGYAAEVLSQMVVGVEEAEHWARQACDMLKVGGRTPPAEYVGLGENIKVVRPDLDVYWQPDFVVGERGSHTIEEWSLRADHPDGQYVVFDINITDAADAAVWAALAEEDEGWTSQSTMAAAKILGSTQIEIPGHEPITGPAAEVAIERELTSGEDAIGIMQETLAEVDPEGLDSELVNWQEIYDKTFDQMGFENPEGMDARMKGYQPPQPGDVRGYLLAHGKYHPDDPEAEIPFTTVNFSPAEAGTAGWNMINACQHQLPPAPDRLDGSGSPFVQRFQAPSIPQQSPAPGLG